MCFQKKTSPHFLFSICIRGNSDSPCKVKIASIPFLKQDIPAKHLTMAPVNTNHAITSRHSMAYPGTKCSRQGINCMCPVARRLLQGWHQKFRGKCPVLAVVFAPASMLHQDMLHPAQAESMHSLFPGKEEATLLFLFLSGCIQHGKIQHLPLHTHEDASFSANPDLGSRCTLGTYNV